MSVEAPQRKPELIDGMTAQEYVAMTDNPRELNLYLAQKCTQSYVIGLEIGTMHAKAPEKVSDFVDYSKWADQQWELERTAAGLYEVDGLWSFMAADYGALVGRQHPLEQFEVQGVAV